MRSCIFHLMSSIARGLFSIGRLQQIAIAHQICAYVHFVSGWRRKLPMLWAVQSQSWATLFRRIADRISESTDLEISLVAIWITQIVFLETSVSDGSISGERFVSGRLPLSVSARSEKLKTNLWAQTQNQGSYTVWNSMEFDLSNCQLLNCKKISINISISMRIWTSQSTRNCDDLCMKCTMIAYRMSECT